MKVATAPLTKNLGMAHHNVVSHVSDDKEGDKLHTQHAQQVIVRIIYHVLEDYQCSKATDFMDICLVTKLTGNLESENCYDWWDNAEVNIWTSWDSCNNDQIMAWQHLTNKHFTAGDCIASHWLNEFVYVSSTNSL